MTEMDSCRRNKGGGARGDSRSRVAVEGKTRSTGRLRCHRRQKHSALPQQLVRVAVAVVAAGEGRFVGVRGVHNDCRAGVEEVSLSPECGVEMRSS